MEFVKDPYAYEKCKKVVKLWEYDFIKNYGRRPSKLDIREADNNVRQAYCTYYKLRSAALEKSLYNIFDEDEPSSVCEAEVNNEKNNLKQKNTAKDEDEAVCKNINENDLKQVKIAEDLKITEQLTKEDVEKEQIWGEHLNKCELKTKTTTVTEIQSKTINSSITKKLFANAKFAKRNPRKSQSFSKHNSSLNISQTCAQSFSQPNDTHTLTNFSEDYLDLSSEFNSLPISSSQNSFISAQSVNVITQLLENEKTEIRKVNKGWLKRVSVNTGINLKPVDKDVQDDTVISSNNCTVRHAPSDFSYNSEDIISDSDEENYQLHTSKRIKLSSSCFISTLKPIITVQPSTASMNINLLECKKQTEFSISPSTKNSVERYENIPILVENAESGSECMIQPVRNETSQDVFKPPEIAQVTELCDINTPDFTKSENSQVESYSEYEEKKTEPRKRQRITKHSKTLASSPTDSTKSENSLEESNSEYEENKTEPRKRKHNKKQSKTPATSSVDSTKSENSPEESNREYEEKKTSPRKRKRITKQSNTPARKINKKINDKPKETTSTRRARLARGAKMEEEKKSEKETEKYEMEYSIKPPPTTVPRFKSLASVTESTLDEKLEEKSEQQQVGKKATAQNRLKKKIESGTLNENFVRLDIKKKVYVRGKRGLNFTKFKKQQWKNKKKALYGPDMDMGGCDGGQLTCFQCGKTGHFARQCKTPTDKLLPREADDEDECLLPSLHEASKMARDSALAIRVPNILELENIPLPDVNTEESGQRSDAYEFQDDAELEDFMMNADIEEHERFSQQCSQSTTSSVTEPAVRPLYNLNSDGSLPDTPKEVFDALKQFGHSSFNPGQEQAVMRILCGQSTLVTLSTGSGKSLCYQLPAYLYAKRTHCISLVISPLVSLMEDQVAGIASCLKAGCLHTNQTQTQKEKVLHAIEAGDLNVLLVSPEAVTAGERKSGFGSLLRKLPPIAFACIDEAHCVSQWSHNFRPSYLVVCRVLRERLGIKTVLGLTATSTYATSTSIVEHLQIPDGRNGVISDIPLPDNLFLSVSSDMQRDAALRNLFSCAPFDEFGSVIVYCTRREECERIASYLRTGIRSEPNETSGKKYKSLSQVAEPYHAGLPASKRRTVQNAFMSGYLRIVVATVAFGMGINKSDIRGVIHYNMPRNFESYVQEVGRAGRDGLPAHCHLFLDSEGKDQNELRRHIYTNSMDRHTIRKLLRKIFLPCECKGTCPRHEVAFSIEDTVKELDIPEENISTLLCYLELHKRRYLEVLTPVYIMCKVIAYGGPQQIKKGALDCPPLAMALALQKKHEQDLTENIFEFPVVDVSAAMGWDSGIAKSKLKNLEWIRENNAPKRSKLTVEFSNLGFHIRSPGNLPPSDLDEALDTLYEKKTSQELTSLQQVQVVHNTLTAVSEKFYHLCLAEKYSSKSTILKTNIREYFSCEQPLKEVEITHQSVCHEDQIAADVRSLLAMYRDNNFTGRSAARIFHGIQSPNFPAVMWGRCKFWRVHLNADFNKLLRICTSEILKLR